MTLQKPMFPPVDPTRRHFLTVAAGASVASVGSLAAASMPGLAPVDPIYAVIEQHRKAALAYKEAMHIEFAFEENSGLPMKGEVLGKYNLLCHATSEASEVMDGAACDLVNTLPTTLAGVVALCQYIHPLFAEGQDCSVLPEMIEFDDDTSAYMAEAFARVIGKAVGELMAAGAVTS